MRVEENFCLVFTFLSPSIGDLKGCLTIMYVGFFLLYSGQYDLNRAEEGANRAGRAGTEEEAIEEWWRSSLDSTKTSKASYSEHH